MGCWSDVELQFYNIFSRISNLQEGLLYAGTDDGIIQVTENGGSSWTKIEAGSIRGIPATAFVNDIRADLYDGSTVYAVLDNHKYGDFKPYLIKSINKGQSWTSINGDLPKQLITWRLVQDHVKRDLLFLASEFGVYFTSNGGTNWIQLKGGIPTISLRDIAIQRRENDLVVASFGRGIYVLDDISPIREFDQSVTKSEATLFKVKPAYWYVQKEAIYGQGHSKYVAKNPPYGAVFTYFLPEKLNSIKSQRQDSEKEKNKQNAEIKFPGWDALEKEKQQEEPAIILTVRDKNGKVINGVTGTNKKGFNRVNWDLSYPDRSGEKLKPIVVNDPWQNTTIYVVPGDYTVSISKRVDGKMTELVSPQVFKVIPLRQGTLKGASYDEITSFIEKYHEFKEDLNATTTVLSHNMLLIDAMKRAADKSLNPTNDLIDKIHNTRMRLFAIDKELTGDKTKAEIGEKSNPTPMDADFVGLVASKSSTYGPTATHKAAINRAVKQLSQIKVKLNELVKNVLPGIEEDLKNAGAPWIEGQGLKD